MDTIRSASHFFLECDINGQLSFNILKVRSDLSFPVTNYPLIKSSMYIKFNFLIVRSPILNLKIATDTLS